MTCTVELEGQGVVPPHVGFVLVESPRGQTWSLCLPTPEGCSLDEPPPLISRWRGSVRETSLSGLSNTKVKNLFSLRIMNNINSSVPLKKHLPDLLFSLLLLHLFMNDPNMWCHRKPSPHLLWYFSPVQTAEPHIH